MMCKYVSCKKTQQLQQEQLELVRAMTRKMIDDDTFQKSNTALKDEQHALKARVAILEAILSRREANQSCGDSRKKSGALLSCKLMTRKPSETYYSV